MKKNIFQKEAKKAFLIELNELKAFYASKDFNVFGIPVVPPV